MNHGVRLNVARDGETVRQVGQFRHQAGREVDSVDRVGLMQARRRGTDAGVLQVEGIGVAGCAGHQNEDHVLRGVFGGHPCGGHVERLRRTPRQERRRDAGPISSLKCRRVA